MAAHETELYRQLIKGFELSGKQIAKPDPTVETEITRIYTQAFDHRNRLVWFYIIYTVAFTLFVLVLIGWQGYERIHLENPKFEIVPQWGLNLLVTGMFVQFIGLLKVVTERVWDFKELFAHHHHIKNGHADSVDEKSSTSK